MAERSGVDMDRAFARLRDYARYTNRGLTDVAESLIAGTLTIDVVADTRRPPPNPRPPS